MDSAQGDYQSTTPISPANLSSGREEVSRNQSGLIAGLATSAANIGQENEELFGGLDDNKLFSRSATASERKRVTWTCVSDLVLISSSIHFLQALMKY